MENKKLKCGTKVKFFPTNEIKGTGKIVGIATNSEVIIGANYIIEPDDNIMNSIYPYSHFVCPEILFEVITDGKHLKTSKEWYDDEKHLYTLLNADGWDRENFQYSFFEEKITKEEYTERITVSTLSIKSNSIFKR